MLGGRPSGTTNRSGPVTCPPGVANDTAPDPALGTANDTLLALAADTSACARLTTTESFAAVGSNDEPLAVTVFPTITTLEDKPLIAGPLTTVNELPLVTLPAGVVTLTGPLLAPTGTVTTNCEPDAELTVAAVPLNDTLSFAGLLSNPVPYNVTLAPTAARSGATSSNETTLAG